MWQLEASGVQHDARHAMQGLAAVVGVSGDGVADGGEVCSDLVGSTGMGSSLQEGVAGEGLEDARVGEGRVTAVAHDLLQAAFVLRTAREAGMKKVEREFAIFPGSGGVGRQIELPDPRLGGESIAAVFRSVGGSIRQSWCGPCFGQGPDALTPGQRAITSFNRNWQNRMGLGGEGYLASPAVVAASALAGYMAPPSELGLPWEPEKYGL